MNPITADRPSMANAIAPTATPMLPPRNVHALMTPNPAPAPEGGKLDSARRGAVAYGNANPTPMANSPTTSGNHICSADRDGNHHAGDSNQQHRPAESTPRPKRRTNHGAENAKISSPPLIGNSDRPAPTGVSHRPVGLWASRL